MTNDIRHFERFKPLKTNAIVGGIQGGLAIRGEGTFIFNIEDDEGKTHTIRIPNSLYVPELPMSLLSPQHWAQEANDNTPIQHGTRMENFADGCKLIWNQLDFAKTIPFEVATNTPVFRTAPSTCSYCAFAASAEDLDDDYYQTEVTPKPSPGYPRRVTPPTPDEFIAEETINMPENGGGAPVRVLPLKHPHNKLPFPRLLKPLLAPVELGRSPSTLLLNASRMRNLTLQQPTHKRNSCDGTID